MAEDKPKHKRHWDWAMVILAAGLLWIGGKFDYRPQITQHKYLIATAKMKDTEFADDVVFVLQHLHRGAVGFVLNHPSKDSHVFLGGPMDKNETYALHSLDVKTPDTLVLDDVKLGFVEGQDAVDRLEKLKPKWEMVFKGHLGWGKNQLENEISDGNWEIVDYSDDIFQTKPDQMWEKARHLPQIRRTH